ncbi:zinc finger protein 394-like [Psammomys obesus]|uniref:zinc finger protein 394-like n=1 Tax=Psammomys obesus TaxID=48139 RepID=UPI0024533C48|nr:zinc finger protein 394-like [Psammomys obesus]
MAVGCEVEVKAEEEKQVPGDWRDPETSRRRFRRLSYADVSGTEKALSGLRELCRRWPSRAALQGTDAGAAGPRAVPQSPPAPAAGPRAPPAPESGEKTAAWARALHLASPQGTRLSSPKLDLRPGENGSSWPRPPRTLVRREHGGLRENGHARSGEPSCLEP